MMLTILELTEFIYEKLKSVIEDIGPSKFAAIITDNASAMRAAWRLLKGDYPKLICLGCSSHIGNLLVKDILKLEWIEQSMEKQKKLSFFSKSSSS